MCLRFMFLLTTRLAAWLRLARREERWKTAEILILQPPARRTATAAAAPPEAGLGGPGTSCDPVRGDTERPPARAAAAGHASYLGPESWILTSPQVSLSRTRLSKKQRRGAAGPAAPCTSARPLRGQAAGGE